MTQLQLEKKLRLWQKRLRLQDWDLKISFQRLADFERQGNIGESSIHMNSKVAHIWVMWPPDYVTCRFARTQNIDLTVVHELLHIHFKPVEKESGSIEVEQAIECISQALIEAYKCADSQRNLKSGRTRSR